MSQTPVAPGSGFYSPRELIYIEPAGRRLTDYEAVICRVQPDVHRADGGGWLLLGADAGSLFDAGSTRLRHPDWFEFRDPSAWWQRTYMREQAAEEKAIAKLLASARHNGCFQELDDYWAREMLSRYYQGFAFAEWGVFLALNRSVRHALSDTLTMTLTFHAVDRLRHQQNIALFGLALEDERGLVEDGQGRDAWLRDPLYQPARRVIERLMSTFDWCEVALVCGLLVDPLVHDFYLRHFFWRFAPMHGDMITPVLAMAANRDHARYRLAAKTLVQMVLAGTDRRGRSVPASENRAVLQAWIDDWAPLILAAVDAFAPLFDRPTMRPELAEVARDRVIDRCRETLERFGLELAV